MMGLLVPILGALVLFGIWLLGRHHPGPPPSSGGYNQIP